MITIKCESQTKITNKKSGLEYESEEQAQEDVNDPSTVSYTHLRAHET